MDVASVHPAPLHRCIVLACVWSNHTRLHNFIHTCGHTLTHMDTSSGSVTFLEHHSQYLHVHSFHHTHVPCTYSVYYYYFSVTITEGLSYTCAAALYKQLWTS